MSQATLDTNHDILVGNADVISGNAAKLDSNHELLAGNASMLAQIAASIEKIALKIGA